MLLCGFVYRDGLRFRAYRALPPVDVVPRASSSKRFGWDLIRSLSFLNPYRRGSKAGRSLLMFEPSRPSWTQSSSSSAMSLGFYPVSTDTFK